MAIKDTVLVIAAHPDDESLGMGGTIHRLVQTGHTLHVLLNPEIRQLSLWKNDTGLACLHAAQYEYVLVFSS